MVIPGITQNQESIPFYKFTRQISICSALSFMGTN